MNFGRKLKFIDKLREYSRIDAACDAYAGERFDHVNGTRAVVETVLEAASEEIDARIEYGDAPILAFNRETDEWDIRNAAYLAEYDARNRTASDRDAKYMSEMRDFADVEGLLNSSLGQTTLDCYYDENLLETDLDQRERLVVLALRADTNVENPQEYVEELDAPIEFFERYKDLGNADLALHAHHFDSSVPDSVVRNVAPPDEWPENLSPESIVTRSCSYCGHNFCQVYRQDAGECYVNYDGEVAQIYTPDDDVLIANIGSTTTHSYCDECMETLFGEEHCMNYTFATEYGVHGIGMDNGMGVDYARWDNYHDNRDPIPESKLNYVEYLVERRGSSDEIALETEPNADASVDAQDDLLRDFTDGEVVPDAFVEHDVCVELDRGRPILRVTRQAEPARQVKEVLNNANHV